MIKQFSGYFIANLISKIIGFYITIYATKYLTPDEYGMVYYYLSLATIIISLTMFGLPGLIFTDYIKLKNDEQIILEKKIYTFFVFMSSVLFIVLCFYFFVKEFNFMFFLLFLFIVSNYFMHLEINILRIKNKIKQLAVIVITSSFLSLLIAFVFLKKNYWILILISTFPALMYTLYFIYERIKSNFDFFQLIFPTINDFKISIPIMLTSFVIQGYYFTNKQYIIMFLNKTMLGIYEIAFKFGNVIEVVLIQVINTIITPILFQKLKEDLDNGKKVIVKVSLISIFIGLTIFLMPDAVWNIIRYFINSSYYESIKFVKFFTLNTFIFEAIIILNCYFMFMKKTKIQVYIFGIILFINLTIGYFFIQKYKLYGILISNMSALIIGFIIMIFFYKKEDKNEKNFS